MSLRSALLWTLCALILCSCGGHGPVMDTGFLQKRKYLNGWDLQLRGGSEKGSVVQRKKVTGPDREYRSIASPIEADASFGTGASLPRTEPIAALGSLPVPIQSPRDHDLSRVRSVNNTPQVISDTRIASTPIDRIPAYEYPHIPQEDLMPRKKWNMLAIPAFLSALVVVYLGLFQMKTLPVIIAIVITFIIAGISLRQIRRKEQAGKGFAIAALLIALLATLYTAMVTAVIGYV